MNKKYLTMPLLSVLCIACDGPPNSTTASSSVSGGGMDGGIGVGGMMATSSSAGGSGGTGQGSEGGGGSGGQAPGGAGGAGGSTFCESINTICGNLYNDATCLGCAGMTVCQPQRQACINSVNFECSSYETCHDLCMSMPSCDLSSTCDLPYPNGKSLYDALVSCAGCECPSLCAASQYACLNP